MTPERDYVSFNIDRHTSANFDITIINYTRKPSLWSTPAIGANCMKICYIVFEIIAFRQTGVAGDFVL